MVIPEITRLKSWISQHMTAPWLTRTKVQMIVGSLPLLNYISHITRHLVLSRNWVLFVQRQEIHRDSEKYPIKGTFQIT
jgi:hypothetical protein